jgi:hypothetical protein
MTYLPLPASFKKPPKRYTPSTKQQLVTLLRWLTEQGHHGSRETIMARNHLSNEELARWEQALAEKGIIGLRQKKRKKPPSILQEPTAYDS